jgi:hypothetical protein
MNTQMTDDLVQTWVRVVDERGQAHLEARWMAVPHAAPAQTPAAHTHAA